MVKKKVAKAVDQDAYDAVIVGAGISGAIVAKELSEQGFRVLVLEAGPGQELSVSGFERYVSNFYTSIDKDNNAPYPVSTNAPMPSSPGTRKVQPGQVDASGYFVQNGPMALDSTYNRAVGGSTMHWQATTTRMLPEDFEMRTRYGQGRDWPISYADLNPYYNRAEREIGVAADVEDQAYLGMTFDPGYVFPMRKLPYSYLDKQVARRLDGTEVEIDGETMRLKVRSIPQGRNAIPNPKYDNGKGYVPIGAVSKHQAEQGGRCQGNTNCTPICPVQAKYDARKTLVKAIHTGQVELIARAVVSRVHVDPGSGRVTHLEYKRYTDSDGGDHTVGIAKGRIFVLAGNAVENARLMLASGLPSSSGLIGRNLMDHTYLLAWGLMPEVAGTMRGPQSTGGIEELRSGAFRRHQAGFRIDIHNEGWGWATGSPYSDLVDIVDNKNLFGKALRSGLVDRISRQLLLAFMVEQLPEASNRVSVDARYKDRLGNLRPVVSYDLSEYSKAGLAYSRQISRQIFQRVGAEDCTAYDPADYGYFTYQGQGYVFRGGNHFAGTHIMGASARDSVVDLRQRSWDHENLYLVGGGSMASIGAANTTVTLAAMCYLSVEHMVKDLRRAHAPSRIREGARA
jgi:choline dehydrogenase-like flavoprotein